MLMIVPVFGLAPLLAQEILSPCLMAAGQKMDYTAFREAQVPPREGVVSQREVEKPRTHRFFDRNNLIGFSAMFATRALDVHSTCRFLKAGYEEKIFPSQNCRTIAVTAFGLSGSGMGGIYWLHRRGHHKLERWLPRIAAISGGVAATWNYSIQ